jgi:hypothetical protein
MPVEEIFRKLQRKTETDLLRQATRNAFQAHAKAYSGVTNPVSFVRNKKIAREVLWFFASIAIGFLMGFIFYEIFSVWLPDAKKELVDLFLDSDSNLIYFLSFVSVAGVYVTRLTIWALSFLQ